MVLEKLGDEPLGWLPQTYHQMDLKKRNDLRQSREHRARARANKGPVGEGEGHPCRTNPSAVLSRDATPSVFHQRHIGRVLRSSCDTGGRRAASSCG
jgi:hypothetical protein